MSLGGGCVRKKWYLVDYFGSYLCCLCIINFFVFQLKMPMLDTKYLMKNPCILNSGEETSQFMNDRTEGRYAIKTLKVRILRFISANGQGEHGCIQLMTMFTHYNSDQGGNLLIILVTH